MIDNDHVRAVAEALAVPTFFVDHAARISIANGAARDLLGASLIGRNHIAVLRQPPILGAIEQVIQGAQRAQATYADPRGARDTTWLAHAAPLACAGGIGVLVSLEDTTATHDADQIRRDFVANVSHELRTPLTALVGFIETLQGAARDDPPARDRFLAIMAREAQRMNRLVQDLLSLSRVESAERMRPRGTFSVPEVLGSVVQALTPMAAERSVRLVLRLDDGLPEIPGDSDQMRQVFTNLIENAVKYGATGSEVDLTARQVERDPGLRAAAVVIDVIDRGEGIDPIHLPRLTERFYRIDSHRSRAMGGTGLGLAIVKHIVNRHRGRLKIASVPGQGSTFSLHLPLT